MINYNLSELSDQIQKVEALLNFLKRCHALQQRGIQLTPDLVRLIGVASEKQFQNSLAIYDSYGSSVYSPSGLFFTLLKNEFSASA